MSVDNMAVELVRFTNWLNKNAIVRVVKGFLPTFLDANAQQFTLIIDKSLQPRTDGKNIYVSLIPCLLNEKFSTEDWLIALKTVTAHEAQHANSSNFSDIKKISDWYGKYLHDNFQLNEGIGSKIGKDVLNIIEDGRIESIAVKRRPGMTVPFMFINELIREGAAIEKKAENIQGEFNDFFNQILSYAKTGLYAPGIKVYQNTDLECNFLAIRALIDDGVNARTSADCREIVELILSEIAPYVASLVENSEDLQKELRRQNNNPSEYTSDNETEYNENNFNGQGAEQSADNQSSNPLRQSSPCKQNGDDNSSDSETGNTQNQGQKEISQSQSGGKEGSSNDSSAKEGDPSQNGSEAGNDQNPKETDYGFDNVDEDKSPLTKERLDEIRSLASAEISVANNAQKAEEKSDEQIDAKTIAEIQSAYSGYTQNIRVSYPVISSCEPLPAELNMQAIELRRAIKRIIENKQAPQNHMSRGLLDKKKLWRVGLADDKLFYRKRNPDNSSCACYLLLDNSGSMDNIAYISKDNKLLQKYEAARTAAAVIEEALESLVPCKIALFNENHNVEHIVIKNFNDKAKINRSWNSLLSLRTGGCNADSVNIRIAAKELLARTEKRKILFVLSDGLPSAYGSQSEATVEVREAVKYARRNGIIVIPIMFGDSKFLNDQDAIYKSMYEKNIVSCMPQQIVSKLTQLFRSVITQ